MADVNLIHVPYRGPAPAVSDLLGGQVQAIFSTMPPVVEHVKGGKLRGLAPTTWPTTLELLLDAVMGPPAPSEG
jgi:tripartite-type tricarboxylate transporter receptor subunit TctC